jgi:hypothetical protein
MTSARLLPIVFLLLGLAAPPAAAAQIYDKITLDELAAVLAKYFKVERDETDGGPPFLLVSGKDNLIGVGLSHCGDDAKCEGVEFFTVLKRKYSLEQVNAFNADNSYSKMVLRAGVTVSLRIEVLTLGGVTDENLVNNAAALMVRENDANGANVASAPKAPAGQTAKLASEPPLAPLLGLKAATGAQALARNPAHAAALGKYLDESRASRGNAQR